MEALRNNFIFILYTGWIMLAVALFIIGGFTFIEDNREHPIHKYRLAIWSILVLFWILMFVLQNIYIYLYT